MRNEKTAERSCSTVFFVERIEYYYNERQNSFGIHYKQKSSAKISLQQSLECPAVSRLIARHLMYGVRGILEEFPITMRFFAERKDNFTTTFKNLLRRTGQSKEVFSMSGQRNSAGAGVYQLENGYWAYRFVVTVNGKKKAQKRVKDEQGKPYKTEKQAARARVLAIEKEQNKLLQSYHPEIARKTVEEVYKEYCEKGRSGKAYTTIKKQDSLWKNHLQARFGNKYIDEITVGEIQDYLAELYYTDNRAYSYTESFLKMFYLIFGQAYSRNYMDVDSYNKMCLNKDTKIHMPKLKIDEDLDIVSFDEQELAQLDSYFSGTNAETAYMLGRYCGLRINECYGLKWSNVDLKNGFITIDRQMQYQEGLIKLVSLKTRNARRKVYMCSKLKSYLTEVRRKQEQDAKELCLQRQQNQTFIEDLNGEQVSSLELVNSLPNGKMQTVNSMKYHSRTLQHEHHIMFKYHYLRHTYGTNLAVLNTPEHLLCNQMGHSNSQVTHRYYIAVSEKGIEELLHNLEKL